MSTIQTNPTLQGGHYTVRVVLSTALPQDQIKLLVDALQVSFDDGTAGLFDIKTVSGDSFVTFYRELSDDVEVIEHNMAIGSIRAQSAASALVAQLAVELAEHQDASPWVQEIVASLKTPGKALLQVADVAELQSSFSMFQMDAGAEYTLKPIGDLVIGDRVDLQTCPYLHQHPAAPFELGVVAHMARETDLCIVIGYEGIDHVGYPLNAAVAVSTRAQTDQPQ